METFLRNTKENPSGKRAILCSLIERISVRKITILCNLIYKFNGVPIKISAGFFMELDKVNRGPT